MTLTLELAPEIEAILRDEARRQGTTLELLAQKALSDRFILPATGQLGRPSDEAMKAFIGKFRSGKGSLSQNTGEQFAEIVAEKRRASGLKG